MSKTTRRMPRISSFDEMPYDDCLLDIIRNEGEMLKAGPKRDAYRTLQTFILMDLHKGGIVRRDVIVPILKELELLLAGPLAGHSKLMTLTGYMPTTEEWIDHETHSPYEDRWDDCPLCWADVISDEQRSWLSELGSSGQGNSIMMTMGMTPLWMECEEVSD